MLTPACKLRGPVLTESLQNPTVCEFVAGGTNHTPCTKITWPLSEKVDLGPWQVDISDRGGSHSARGPKKAGALKGKASQGRLQLKIKRQLHDTMHDGLRQLRVGTKSQCQPASLVIWIESPYGRSLLDRRSAPFEQMKHRSALEAVSPPVSQRLLSHFAYLEGKNDNATPSPPRPRAEFKAQPNHTP